MASEWHVGDKFRALIELVLAVWVFVWLLAIPVPTVFSTRLYFTLAVSIAAGFLIFCWDVFIASVARKQDWMPRTCFLAGASVVFVPGSIWCLLAESPFTRRAYLLLCVASLAGYVCRKFAHPELTDQQATAPEPPITLFPKQNSVLTDSQSPTSSPPFLVPLPATEFAATIAARFACTQRGAGPCAGRERGVLIVTTRD